MNERVWSETDLVRRAKRRLAVLQHAEEVSGNVAATCRYYGISRAVFYRWKRRYEDEGLDGLKVRSIAPMHCSTTTSPEVVGKIVDAGCRPVRAGRWGEQDQRAPRPAASAA